MKSVVTGLVLMVLVSLGAYFTLQQMGYSSEDTFSGPSVRLD
ncbi:hypothetical protein [Thalassococcus lentus]|uniref:Uncharacterized protein n=1 Tax=Thalassococcus lentus TaxID=1210524 RepID=A0ABT4XXJ4_9RHOB|nr:hypothetical protein [Thalassococcus lentus]MDA7426674.1 hypothetical protein [Thalassococcus lentus]